MGPVVWGLSSTCKRGSTTVALDPTELRFIRPLRDLDDEQILEFVGACEPVSARAGSLLIAQGEVDPSMLFVLVGTLETWRGEGPTRMTLRRFVRGEQLGELSVLGLVPRRMISVAAESDVDLLVLDETGLGRLRAAHNPVVERIEGEALRSLAQRLREIDREIATVAVGDELDEDRPHPWQRLMQALSSRQPTRRPPDVERVLQESPTFTRLTRNLRQQLADQLEPVAFARGDAVLQEGDYGGDAWIVGSGEIGAWRTTEDDRREHLAVLGPGTLFGHVAIVDGESRTATCVAETPAWLFRLPRALGEALVDDPSAEGMVLRRCLMDALVAQLAQANDHLALVQQRAAEVRAETVAWTDDMGA